VAALIVVPALVALATLLSRRFGHAIGGVMAGLPLTSGPLSVTLAIGHGHQFAADAAVGSLVGILGSTVSCIAYGLTAKRGWLRAAIAGLAAFTAAIALGVALPATLASSALVAAAAALVAIAILRRLRPAVAPLPPQPGIWPRVISAFVVVAVVLAVARTVGAELAGALTPLPVVIGVLAVHAHRDDGPEAAIEVLYGSQRGTFGFIAFFTLAGALLERDVALGIVYVAATAAALTTALFGIQLGRSREPTA
jgi:hypothetical protein